MQTKSEPEQNKTSKNRQGEKMKSGEMAIIILLSAFLFGFSFFSTFRST